MFPSGSVFHSTNSRYNHKASPCVYSPVWSTSVWSPSLRSMLAAFMKSQLLYGFPRTPNKWPLWGIPGMGTSQLVGILGTSCLHISICLWAEAALLGRLAGCTRQACFLQGPGDGIFHAGEGRQGDSSSMDPWLADQQYAQQCWVESD